MFIDRSIIVSLANFMLIIVYIAQITILLVIDDLKLMKSSTLSCELVIQTNN
jgi:hypothetical protein